MRRIILRLDGMLVSFLLLVLSLVVVYNNLLVSGNRINSNTNSIDCGNGNGNGNGNGRNSNNGNGNGIGRDHADLSEYKCLEATGELLYHCPCQQHSNNKCVEAACRVGNFVPGSIEELNELMRGWREGPVDIGMDNSIAGTNIKETFPYATDVTNTRDSHMRSPSLHSSLKHGGVRDNEQDNKQDILVSCSAVKMTEPTKGERWNSGSSSVYQWLQRNAYRSPLAADLATKPVTLFGIVVLIGILLLIWKGSFPHEKVVVTAHHVLLDGETWRLITATLGHFELWHLAINAVSFYNLGGLETITGSWDYFLMLCFHIQASSVLLVVLHWIIGTFVSGQAHLMSTRVIGFSGVLFALMTVACARVEEYCIFPGYCMPTKTVVGTNIRFNMAPLAMLLIMQFLLRGRASFWGHLAGILTGISQVTGAIDPKKISHLTLSLHLSAWGLVIVGYLAESQERGLSWKMALRNFCTECAMVFNTSMYGLVSRRVVTLSLHHICALVACCALVLLNLFFGTLFGMITSLSTCFMVCFVMIINTSMLDNFDTNPDTLRIAKALLEPFLCVVSTIDTISSVVICYTLFIETHQSWPCPALARFQHPPPEAAALSVVIRQFNSVFPSIINFVPLWIFINFHSGMCVLAALLKLWVWICLMSTRLHIFLPSAFQRSRRTIQGGNINSLR